LAAFACSASRSSLSDFANRVRRLLLIQSLQRADDVKITLTHGERGNPIAGCHIERRKRPLRANPVAEYPNSSAQLNSAFGIAPHLGISDMTSEQSLRVFAKNPSSQYVA